LVVRLLGIQENGSDKDNAVNFLREKTLGQKVFLKFDKQKYDDQNNLLCYLYLKNKTFINAHLIKNGLAEVDHSRPYKYEQKFERLSL